MAFGKRIFDGGLFVFYFVKGKPVIKCREGQVLLVCFKYSFVQLTIQSSICKAFLEHLGNTV